MCQPAAQLVPRVAGASPVFCRAEHESPSTLRRLGSTLRRTGAYLSRSTYDPGGQKSFREMPNEWQIIMTADQFSPQGLVLRDVQTQLVPRKSVHMSPPLKPIWI